MKPYNPVNVNRIFEGKGRRISQGTNKHKAGSKRAMLDFHRNKRRYIPEDRSFQQSPL
jgi:hypothetical protein